MASADSPWALPTTVATRALALPGGQLVQAWCPAPGETHRLGWYEPAAALAHGLRAGTGAHLPLDDLQFLGRIDGTGGPALWAYERPATAAIVLVDVDGVPHEPVADARRRVGYRFEAVPLAGAAAALGLRADPGGADGGARGVVLLFRRR